MTHWNYRVIHDYDDDDEGDCYGIHEVFYGVGGVADAVGPPHTPFGISADELREELAMMAQAFERPTLEFSDFGQDGERMEADDGN